MHRIEETPLPFAQMGILKNYSSQFSRLDSDIIYSHIDPLKGVPRAGSPFRIDGWMMALCVGGSIEMEIDLKSCTLRRGSLACVGLDNIVRLRAETARDFEAYIIVMTPAFMRDLNIDLNIINIAAMAKARSVAPSPLIISDGECEKLQRLLEVIHLHNNTDTIPHYRRSIAKNLVGALLYNLMMIGDSVTPAGDDSFANPSTRRSIYVHKFMRLVQNHHRAERTISFYADKLFISPKYLSLIIKESTGRSASQWIDDMVILEAKNMLRFSGKNIQQVAYELHFCNQSAFGKYFKHLTGMSPSQYQRS